tara:strand:+ start:543 stop:1430 length:888 start_codon:yes stop_codon:yes gene_type:complete
MIYESVVTTGRVSISGCSSPDMGADIVEKRNVAAINTASEFYYDRDLTTGSNFDKLRSSIRLSLNGQTLQQEIQQTTQTINQSIYQIFTGDFFTKPESAPILETTTLNFDETTPAKATSNIVYNIITGGIFAGEKDFGRSLKTGITNSIGSSHVFTDFDYFLNGQKVYSGDGVGVFLGAEFAGLTATGFQPNFSTAANVNGVVIDERKTFFKYTASKKSKNTLSATGLSPDMKGQKFIEKRTNFYINGVEELQSNYLELYSGVITIKSGVSATLPSSGFEPYVVGGENSTEEFIL